MTITEELLCQCAPMAEQCWLDTLPKEVPEHQFSRRFERHMKKLIKQQRHAPAYRRTAAAMKRAAMIALVSAVVVFSSLMTVEACRERVLEVIVQVFQEYTAYRFESTSNDSTVPAVTFGYVPEGMRQTMCDIDDFSGRGKYLYEGDDGAYFELRQQVIVENMDHRHTSDTENTVTEYFEVDGEQAVARTKYGETTIIWTKDNSVYTLYGNFGSGELRKILENMEIDPKGYAR